MRSPCEPNFWLLRSMGNFGNEHGHALRKPLWRKPLSIDRLLIDSTPKAQEGTGGRTGVSVTWSPKPTGLPRT